MKSWVSPNNCKLSLSHSTHEKGEISPPLSHSQFLYFSPITPLLKPQPPPPPGPSSPLKTFRPTTYEYVSASLTLIVSHSLASIGKCYISFGKTYFPTLLRSYLPYILLLVPGKTSTKWMKKQKRESLDFSCSCSFSV